jgi:hypothetical protein
MSFQRIPNPAVYKREQFQANPSVKRAARLTDCRPSPKLERDQQERNGDDQRKEKAAGLKPNTPTPQQAAHITANHRSRDTDGKRREPTHAVATCQN